MPTQSLKNKKKNQKLSGQKKTKSLKRLSPPPLSARQKSSDYSFWELDPDIKTLHRQIEFILGATQTGLDMIDSDFNIRYIDPEWAKAYGDPTGRKCYKYFMDRKTICPGCGIPTALKSKKITVTEKVLVKEGSRPVQVTTIPFQNSNGEWLVAEVNVDISERKKTEKILQKVQVELEIRVNKRTKELAQANEALKLEFMKHKKAEETLRDTDRFLTNIFESIQDGFSVLDKDMNILRTNRVIEKSCAHAMPLVGKKCFEAYYGRDRRCDICPAYESILTGKSAHHVVPKAGAGGKTVGWVDLYSFPLIDFATGAINGVIEHARDITERKRAEEALHESTEQAYFLADILERSEQAFAVGYPDGRIGIVNAAFCKLTGYSAKELHSTNWAKDLTPPEWQAMESEKLDESNRTGEPVRYEKECLRKDGTRVPIELLVQRIDDETGKGHHYNSFITDITERKRAEEALKKSEERFQMVAHATNDAIYDWDLVNNTAWLSETHQTLFGDAESRSRYEWWHSRIHPDDREKIAASMKATIDKGGPIWTNEYRFQRKDGSYAYIFDRGYILRDNRGRPVRLIGAMMDITERRRAEEAFLKTQKLLNSLMDHAPMPIIVFSNDNHVRLVNRAWEKKMHLDRKEIVGNTLDKFVPEATVRQIYDGNQKVLQTGEPSVIEETVQQGTEEIYAQVIRFPLLNAAGRVESIGVILLDMTDLKKTEEMNTLLQEQLRQSQKMEAIGQLAGGIAHDFNNLLTIIKGYCQFSLIDIKEGDPLGENIEEIKHAADRAAELTRQLLAFSRRQIMEMRVLDLNFIIQNLEKMLRRLIGENIELVIRPAEDLGRVKTDPGQIEQVIMNLVVNARDAMPQGGKLFIETANVELDETYTRAHLTDKPGLYVMLSVSDTGTGMTPDIRERVFDPFFTTKEKDKGTGLGLSTVYGIVKQSGGDTWVYSEPGQGTTFKVYLPRVNEPLEEWGDRAGQKELPKGSETVLVVEDEEEVRKLAVRILRRQGYTVMEAPQGGNALMICEQHKEPIHLMVTDVVMPGMSGHELAKRLKPLHPEMKVLYMSGYTDDTIVHHGILMEGIHYLHKPFAVEALILKVREVLDLPE